jgi:aminocarboxymuconate-semialdehyde decarboxylase
LRDNGFAHYYRRIWFDTHVHDERSLQLLVDHAGPDRLVYGTNFAGWDSGGDHGPGELVDTLTANAERLLRI